ncbi:MAG: FAD-dependent oxidoreductase [Sphingorhabdus sp.]
MKNNLNHSIHRRAFVGGMSASLIACAAPQKTWGKTSADVIIIGAGLAGLHAASIIENAGYKAIILEGNDRTGGRLYTLDALPGRPDAGGIQIGPDYERFHAIADKLGVERYVPPLSLRDALYNIGGQSLTASQWLGAKVNSLSPNEKATPPDTLFFRYIAGLPKLENVADWMKQEAQTIDIPFKAFLVQQGASEEAQRLINANLNGNGINTLSALHVARTMAIFAKGRGPIQFVRGGSQQMTNAMAGALNSEVILRSVVSAIQVGSDGVEIRLAGGRKLAARHVICTAPFSALREMRIEAELPPEIRLMIAKLPYTRASFAYLQATEPFWMNDGLPETIWSDDPLLGRVFVLGNDPAMLKVWTNGGGADLVDGMSDADAGAAMIGRIETARPSAVGKLKLVRMFSWQKNRFARGIYHHIGAGQAAPLATASKYQGRRLHFAGEHLAQENSGIEGALESGERAAAQVLRNL